MSRKKFKNFQKFWAPSQKNALYSSLLLVKSVCKGKYLKNLFIYLPGGLWCWFRGKTLFRFFPWPLMCETVKLYWFVKDRGGKCVKRTAGFVLTDGWVFLNWFCLKLQLERCVERATGRDWFGCAAAFNRKGRGTQNPNEPSESYCVITFAVVRSDAYGRTRKFLNGANL